MVSDNAALLLYLAVMIVYSKMDSDDFDLFLWIDLSQQISLRVKSKEGLCLPDRASNCTNDYSRCSTSSRGWQKVPASVHGSGTALTAPGKQPQSRAVRAFYLGNK
ncbi:hypothetical protein RRG08_005241 [Elysia crispata]|uniref:Uncharacterized protein n=1 Tax=Elysia crispata TaxID=231223 RepID=A0AAE1E331_9GAST|nr:hypothetical protein RRG08_005241 [Elysia crispata]